METVSRIVCPVDLSKGARDAVARAATLARLHHAELHLLHVPGGGDESPPPSDHAQGVGLGVVVGAALWGPEGADPNDEVPLRLATERGHPVKAIAAYARRAGADLIAIGAQYGASRSWARGSSVAAALGRSAPCPVFVAPQPDHTLPAPSRLPVVDVLCVVDFMASPDAALRVGIGLVKRGGGRLTLVHVVGGCPDRTIFSASGALRRLRAYQAPAAGDKQRLRGLIPPRELDPSRVEPLVVAGPLHQAILRAASEVRPDLVVMNVTPGSAASAARAILRRATCPVLLTPAPEAAARVNIPAFFDAMHGARWMEPSPGGLVHQERA